MGYLIGQILVCLLIAAVIGFIAGWLVRGLSYRQRGTEHTGARGDETVQQPAAIPQEAVAETKTHHSDYRIEEIDHGQVCHKTKNTVVGGIPLSQLADGLFMSKSF